jgi:hypothetical protein
VAVGPVDERDRPLGLTGPLAMVLITDPRRGHHLNTGKTHLKHVFDKTGETRQADLVRRVSTYVALRFGSGQTP